MAFDIRYTAFESRDGLNNAANKKCNESSRCSSFPCSWREAGNRRGLGSRGRFMVTAADSVSLMFRSLDSSNSSSPCADTPPSQTLPSVQNASRRSHLQVMRGAFRINLKPQQSDSYSILVSFNRHRLAARQPWWVFALTGDQHVSTPPAGL